MTLRILVVSPFPPSPTAAHGGGAYLGALLEALGRRAELGAVTLRRPSDGDAPDQPWRELGQASYRGDPPPSSRWRHKLRLAWRWRRDPLLVAKHWQPELAAALRAALRSFAPHAAMVEQVQMGQYLPFLGELPAVLTDHESGIPANAATGHGAWLDRRDARLWPAYLRRCSAAATIVQALTAEDAAALGTLLGRTVLVRPPAFPLPREAVEPGRAPPRALFLGDYRHRPNPEAAGRIAAEVLPRIRAAVPNAELWLAGTNAESIRHLAALPGVRLVGYVDDLRELLGSVRLLLAPLWSGSGVRVKAMAALAHGLPVVTNALGARGLAAPPPACTTAESHDQIAAAAVELLRLPAFAAAAGRAAFGWAGAHLAAEAVAALQLDRIAALVAARG